MMKHVKLFEDFLNESRLRQQQGVDAKMKALVDAIDKEQAFNDKNFKVRVLSRYLRVLKDAAINGNLDDLLAKDADLKKDYDTIVKKYKLEKFEDFISEKNHYSDDKIRKIYTNKIKPVLVDDDAELKKKDTQSFFNAHKEKMKVSLEMDESNVKKLCEAEIERLKEKLEKGEGDKARIEKKIGLVEKYMKSEMKKINEEKKKYTSFFNKNPKIIVA